ncbi:MAG: 1,4-dihydroxy-2-naphthoate polyprenyltransferase [Bacteroidota bacterium]|nr:1,4-dihydroxy-2-naphthoate polyprenyltransferase [Bacteroidota bacterium]
MNDRGTSTIAAGDPGQISRMQAWILAARPKTLPAAVVPVLVGSAVAADAGVFDALPAAIALVCALLIQIGTNLANDYFDFLKGADSEHRIGPIRVTQSGLIPPGTVRAAMIGVFALTFLLGLTLVVHAGWPILVIGVTSLICAVIYTAGPYPLAYIGLGDLFVFIFFGIVAVNGTYFVQALDWSSTALIASLPVGAISTAILVVNNYRDIDTDRVARKRTMAVRLGRLGSRVEFQLLMLLAFVVPVLQVLFGGASLWMLLPLSSLPIALHVLRVLERATTASHADGVALNSALARTGQLLAMFGVLYAVGLSLS